MLFCAFNIPLSLQLCGTLWVLNNNCSFFCSFCSVWRSSLSSNTLNLVACYPSNQCSLDATYNGNDQSPTIRTKTSHSPKYQYKPSLVSTHVVEVLNNLFFFLSLSREWVVMDTEYFGYLRVWFCYQVYYENSTDMNKTVILWKSPFTVSSVLLSPVFVLF